MTGILHIVVARKPIEGTVAENCLLWHCGAINVDGCRIQGAKGSGVWGTSNKTISRERMFNASPEMDDYRSQKHDAGRFPANLILDTSEKVQENFPEAGNGWKKNYGEEDYKGRQYGGGSFGGGGYKGGSTYADSGSASRFFFNFAEQESDEK